MHTTINMDKKSLRKFMLQEKSFLGHLFKSNAITAKKELVLASANQIKLVICVCHFITIGEIPLTSKGFEALKNGRRAGVMHKSFLTKASTNRLLKSPRREQLTLLLKLSSCYNYLFHSLFNEPLKKPKKDSED